MSSFYHGVSVYIFRVHPEMLDNGLVKIIDIGRITDENPVVYAFCADFSLQDYGEDLDWEYECYPSCTVEVSEDGVTWEEDGELCGFF